MSGLQSKKIVVPVDFSDFSIAALDRAVEIVADDGSIEVIHILPELSAMEPGVMYGMLPNEKRIESIKDKLREKFSDDKYSKVNLHCQVGDFGRAIAGFAKQQEADLIVISSHGYGFVKHILLGSVAERVVRLAHCPVLVLRT